MIFQVRTSDSCLMVCLWFHARLMMIVTRHLTTLILTPLSISGENRDELEVRSAGGEAGEDGGGGGHPDDGQSGREQGGGGPDIS